MGHRLVEQFAKVLTEIIVEELEPQHYNGSPSVEKSHYQTVLWALDGEEAETYRQTHEVPLKGVRLW